MELQIALLFIIAGLVSSNDFPGKDILFVPLFFQLLTRKLFYSTRAAAGAYVSKLFLKLLLRKYLTKSFTLSSLHTF